MPTGKTAVNHFRKAGGSVPEDCFPAVILQDHYSGRPVN